MSTNPINFRLPVRVDRSVHPSVQNALTEHDNSIVDLRQANASIVSQLATLQAHVQALLAAKNG